MTQLAGYVDTRSARRLANTIGMLKTVLISLIALCTALGAMANGGVLAVMVLLGGAVSAGCVYVTFGWLEHTLMLLICIAYNTAERAHLIPQGED